MVVRIADNITSPLGLTTESNCQALLCGESRLKRMDEKVLVPEVFTASMFSEDQWQEIARDGFTKFESLAIYSISEALTHVDIEVSSARTCLILSTTKGNIEVVDEQPCESSPSVAAKHIADIVGVTTQPMVSCNACISGVSAIILAQRLLDAGVYDTAIVCGADVLGRFVVSGFLSLKAVSADPCRPFDIERLGLNLGEAAATIILQNTKNCDGEWHIVNGAVGNDAIHITNPSPKGIGSQKAIRHCLGTFPTERLALVNAHGTATMFNDQMESKAIEGVGMSNIPINALKGYYGHTMGAAGVLETIVSMAMLDRNTILGTRGFDEIGVSGKISISKDSQFSDKKSFMKIISGFGGCNGAILCTKEQHTAVPDIETEDLQTSHSVNITSTVVEIDGVKLITEGSGKDMLTYVYKTYIGNYPKFHKMDILSRLGFVASELLLQAEGGERYIECDERGILLFNESSSVCADLDYNKSIANKDSFFPSPSVFVYTLPNIVTGEIALRNNYHGETSFYILPKKDYAQMSDIIKATMKSTRMKDMICGWINADSTDEFEVELKLIKIQ